MKLDASTRLQAKTVQRELLETLADLNTHLDSVLRRFGSMERFENEDPMLFNTVQGIALRINDLKKLVTKAVPVITKSEPLQAAVLADLADPLSDGTVYDMLVDGEPGDDTPAVQTVTKDDGAIGDPPEQELLNDDLVVPNIEFAS